MPFPSPDPQSCDWTYLILPLKLLAFVPINIIYLRTQSLQFSSLVGILKRNQQGIKSSLSFCFHQTLSLSAVAIPPHPGTAQPLRRSSKSITCFQGYTHGPFSAPRQTTFPCVSLKPTRPCPPVPNGVKEFTFLLGLFVC